MKSRNCCSMVRKRGPDNTPVPGGSAAGVSAGNDVISDPPTAPPAADEVVAVEDEAVPPILVELALAEPGLLTSSSHETMTGRRLPDSSLICRVNQVHKITNKLEEISTQNAQDYNTFFTSRADE
jgi:hypothetical protein